MENFTSSLFQSYSESDCCFSNHDSNQLLLIRVIRGSCSLRQAGSMMPADLLFSRPCSSPGSNCQVQNQRSMESVTFTHTPISHCNIGRFPLHPLPPRPVFNFKQEHLRDEEWKQGKFILTYAGGWSEIHQQQKIRWFLRKQPQKCQKP